MAIDWGTELGGNSPQQPDSAVSAVRNNPEVAAQYAAIDRLQRVKNMTKRYIDHMGQSSTETPGGIFGRLWPYGGKVYTDQQVADAKSAVDRAQNEDETYQAIRNLDYAGHHDDVGTGVVGEFVRGMNNTPIPSIGNNSFLGNNRTTYELPGDDRSWAYAIGKYGGGGLELASDLAGAGDVLKMAKAARFNPFAFAGMLYSDAKQTGKDIVNLPGNIVNGIRNAGNKTADFVKDSVKAGIEGKSLKEYRTPASAGEAAQTGGRAAETAADGGVSELANAGNVGREAATAGEQAAGREAATAGEQAAGREAATAGEQAAGREAAAPAAERTAASEAAAPAAERTAASEAAAPAAERTAASEAAAPAAERTAASETAAPATERTAAPAEGSPELRSNENGTPDLSGAINGEGSASGAAGTAARQGEDKATEALAEALSNYDRQQYRAYINGVQNDRNFADLVSPTLNQVVGNTGRSIDSLSDAELSAFYKALNDAVNDRWAQRIIGVSMN